MNNIDKVSIIIPIYNGERFIIDTVKSCQQQTYNNIEIIAIDDNSSDSSLNVLKENFKKNELVILSNKKNEGFTQSANNGIEKSSGDFILVLGQDDLLDPTHIEKVLKHFKYDVSLVYTHSIIIDEYANKRQLLPHRTFDKEITLYDFSLHNCIHSCGLIMNKQKFLEAGKYNVDPRWKNYGEWDLWIRMRKLGKIKLCSDVYSFYRRHDSNISNEFITHSGFKIHRTYSLTCMKLAFKIGNFSSPQTIGYIYNYIMYYFKSAVKIFIYNLNKYLKK